MQALSARTTTVLQWIRSHCHIAGNEEADKLSKAGSRLTQSAHPLSFGEAKTILRSHFRNSWREWLHLGPEEDSIHQLGQAQQVIILRPCTGHCQLLSHLYKLKISHTDQCPCDTAAQTPAHVRQDCPLHKELRHQIWPSPAALQDKLWATATELQRTS
ncbi:uncharacterized protein LOC143281871 [Babylonia areolata]|uniref:uncharacterized protein LOC143281871 n=1 Tax=Babylonia areolata TaxID=304850 RepID=UPI003FD4932D